jgi:fatty acid desaturase
MGKAGTISIGVILMNIAVAAYLFATGIIGIGEKRWFSGGGEIRKAVGSLFKGDLANVLVIIFAVLAIAAGVFILLKLFGVGIRMLDLILVILAIAWLVFIIMIDIIRPLFGDSKPGFVDWLRDFGAHLMVLSGMILAMDRSRK